MRLMPVGGCLGIAVLSSFIFLTGYALTDTSKVNEKPIWERTCILEPDGDKHVNVVCGDYKTEWSLAGLAWVAKVVKNAKPTVVCKAFNSRLGSIITECD